MNKIVCIIPARLSSTRLPQKPLLNILGKTMVERTYKRAIKVFNAEDIFVATDSAEIKKVVSGFGGNVLMTSENCLTGTDRVAEASNLVDADYYINLQGDEPIMPTKNIEAILNAARFSSDSIYNGYASINDISEYQSSMIPKVVVSETGGLMYMSRSPIPGNKEGAFQRAYKQICLYAFTRSQLDFYYNFGRKSSNEGIEDIEILRFVDNDYSVRMIEMSPNTVAVDTIADYTRVQMIISSQGEDRDEYDIG